jgi:hypothetical protein
MEKITDTLVKAAEAPSNTHPVAQKTATLLRIPCEVYSRVVGYLRPVQNWNAGKQQEFKDRTLFNVDTSGE